MQNDAITSESQILRLAVALLFPFMLLFGFYIILNGHYTPGGGFQGGGILASLFIARYIIFPVDDIDSERLHTMQRFFLAAILIVPTLVLFTGVLAQFPALQKHYLTLMDVLIGVQVGFGLGVAVLRFAFFQGSGQTWHL